MKTKIFLISLSLFFLSLNEIFSCPPTTTHIYVNRPYGSIICQGYEFQANQYRVWLINIGQGQPQNVRLRYYKDTQANDYLRFYNVTSLENIYSCINNDGLLIEDVSIGYKRGTITTTIPSGCCIVMLRVQNGGNGNYPGIQFDFSPAPEDSTVVTETSSMVLGSQYVMEKLGIGTDMPVTPLHIRENAPLERSNNKFVPLTRLEGRTMDLNGSTPIFTDEAFYRNDTNLSYILGTSYGNTSSYGVDPELISSWIRQTPEQKSIALGSGSVTSFEAKRLTQSTGTDPESEVIIGGVGTKNTGHGSKLTFLGASENSAPLFMSRYNQGSGKADLRMSIGASESNDKRFVIGRTVTTGSNSTWYPKFTFTANGKLGIGVENPQYPLHVNGTIYATRIEAASISTSVSGSGDSTLYVETSRIGINTTHPFSPLHVYNITELGTSSTSSYVPIATFQGNPKGVTPFKNTLWLKRDASGSDWTTARLHDGISIGDSIIPRTNTSTFWERDPKDSLQIWGHKQSVYMVLNGRNLGIGETSPSERLHVNGNIKADSIKVNGSLGIGVNSPSERLHVNGNIKADTVKARNLMLENGNITTDLNVIKLSATNRIAVGNAPNDAVKLHVHQNAVLGNSKDSYTRIATISGQVGGGNSVYNNLYVVRGDNVSGAEYLTACFHDGLSYNEWWGQSPRSTTPSHNSMCWWERYPAQNKHQWGHHDKVYMTLKEERLGIGVTDPQHALDVNGTVHAKKVIITETVAHAPDYVFAPDYKLLGLKEVEEHINEHQHLPEVPSAAEIAEKGVDVIDLNFKLLQKIEELTLYVIEQNKRISTLEKALEEK